MAMCFSSRKSLAMVLTVDAARSIREKIRSFLLAPVCSQGGSLPAFAESPTVLCGDECVAGDPPLLIFKQRRMCFGGFRAAKSVEVLPTPVGGAPPEVPWGRNITRSMRKTLFNIQSLINRFAFKVGRFFLSPNWQSVICYLTPDTVIYIQGISGIQSLKTPEAMIFSFRLTSPLITAKSPIPPSFLT